MGLQIVDPDGAESRPHELARKRDRAEPLPAEPEEPRGRATADTWMDWKQTVCAPMMRPVFWGLARTPEAERDHDAINAGIELGYKVWGVLDRHLADRPFVAGDTLTMGDIPSARRPIAGSTWWRSARRCRTSTRGIGALPSVRHSART